MEKSLCIVLRTTNYRDNDKMLTLFSRDNGRVDALARGCRKGTSSLLSCSQLFTCGLYAFYTRAGKYYVSQCEVVDAFYALREDMARFSAAALVAEACEKSVNPEEPNARLFSLAANVFYALKQGDPLAIAAFFLVKFADALGYCPHIVACVDCGARTRSGGNRFSARAGGCVCAACARKRPDATDISADALRAAHAALRLPVKAASQFDAKSDALRELLRVFVRYAEEKLDMRLISAAPLEKSLQTP